MTFVDFAPKIIGHFVIIYPKTQLIRPFWGHTRLGEAIVLDRDFSHDPNTECCLAAAVSLKILSELKD